MTGKHEHPAPSIPDDLRFSIVNASGDNAYPLAPTHAQEFRPDAVYETLVDTNGDAKPENASRYRFTRKEHDRQFAHVSRVELRHDLQEKHLEGEGDDDDHLLVAHAGFRSDAFFFDLRTAISSRSSIRRASACPSARSACPRSERWSGAFLEEMGNTAWAAGTSLPWHVLGS